MWDECNFGNAHIAGVYDDESGLTRVVNGDEEGYYYKIPFTGPYILVARKNQTSTEYFYLRAKKITLDIVCFSGWGMIFYSIYYLWEKLNAGV